MTDAIQHYHQKYLERAAEDNPNNARVPQQKNKGYIECRDRGWIEERMHPHGAYAFFAITESGKAALRQPKAAKPVRTSPRLRTLKPRLSELSLRLKRPAR